MLQALQSLFTSSSVYSTPTREEFLSELEATKFTPDVSTLEEYDYQLYFATDNTKKDHLYHELLGDAKYKFPAFTQANFHFWDPPEPWTQPIPMELVNDHNVIRGLPPVAKIKGEVYLIRPQRFIDLDRLKQNTVEYVRRRVRLIVPFRHVVWLKDHNLDPAFGVQDTFCRSEYNGSSVRTTEERVVVIRAWMYIGKPEYWDPLITLYDYKSVETFYGKNRRWCEQYYSIRRPQLPPK